MKLPLSALAIACAALAACSSLPAAGGKVEPRKRPAPPPIAKEVPVSLTLSSTAFKPMGSMPKEHTCDGADVSPPLAWSGAPAGTKSFALIVDDPDAPDPAAPRLVWVHWVLYDLPAQAGALVRGTTARNLPPGTREGLNDWKQTGWRGPCPPIGRHRYFHKLYALDIVLPDLHHPTKAALEKAMEGHVLAKTELVGTYQRGR